MRRAAFTLIELLVVIAIISILAAILFPVFAQARVAAKGIVSVSNLKQISMAQIMYQESYDDMIVRLGTYGSADPDRLQPGVLDYATWALSLDPYQKSVDINSSPLGAPAYQGGDASKRRSGTRFMSYGFNYTYLNPAPRGQDPNNIVQRSISGSSVGSPSETIIFTERTSRAGQDYSQLYSFGGRTGYNLGQVEIPDCYNNAEVECMTGWGVDNDWIFLGVAIGGPEEGRDTGMVAARVNQKAPVAFVDGHVKSLSLGAIAGGTNWNPTISVGDVTITDRSAYLWDTQ